jgi:tetratricopeptide (TPR) repeat protein/GTPase SAR1 family protein
MNSQREKNRKDFSRKCLETISKKKVPSYSELERLSKEKNFHKHRSVWQRIFTRVSKEPERENIDFLAKYLGIEPKQVWDVLKVAEKITEVSNVDEAVDEFINDFYPIFRIPGNMPSSPKYFFGRKEDIKNLEDKVLDESSKITVIVGFAGTGKTTLINQLIRDLHQRKINWFTKVAWFEFNTQENNGRPPSIKEFITNILQSLSDGQITSESTNQDRSSTIKERLLSYLEHEKCLIVLDNAEVLLSRENKDSDNLSLFAENCTEYHDMLEKISNGKHHSKLILTSRRSLNIGINLDEFSLSGLEQKDGKELILNLSKDVKTSSHELKAEESELTALVEEFSGNPKVIELAIPFIQKSKVYQGSVSLFLKQKKPVSNVSFMLVELLNLLNKPQQECLKRITVYRTLLSHNCIYSQMDVIDKTTIDEFIDVNFLHVDSPCEDDNSLTFRMHPLIKEFLYGKLDKDTLNESHKKAGEYWLLVADDCKKTSKKRELVDALFEAMHHFFEAEEFDKCYQTFIFDLLHGEKKDNLRCSANLWNNVDRIIEIDSKLINKLSDDNKRVTTLIPMGVVYSETGKNQEALKVSDEILKITDKKLTKEKHLMFPQIAAFLIKGRAYRLIGNFAKSKENCQLASRYAAKHKNLSWEALAIYELALIDIELEKPVRALGCLITAAYKAIGAEVVPKGVSSFKKLLSGENFKPEAEEEIEKIIKDNSKDDSEDHTKKFRILYNAGRALNLLNKCRDDNDKKITLRLVNWSSISEFILGLANRFVVESDKGSPVWLYTELATCYSKSPKAYEYLEKAYSLKETAPMICNALTLYKYAELEYSSEHYGKALNKYKELEKLLKNAEFPLWEMQAHQGQANCYRKLYSTNRCLNLSKKAEYQKEEKEHLDKVEEICEKWNLNKDFIKPD